MPKRQSFKKMPSSIFTENPHVSHVVQGWKSNQYLYVQGLWSCKTSASLHRRRSTIKYIDFETFAFVCSFSQFSFTPIFIGRRFTSVIWFWITTDSEHAPQPINHVTYATKLNMGIVCSWQLWTDNSRIFWYGQKFHFVTWNMSKLWISKKPCRLAACKYYWWL